MPMYLWGYWIVFMGVMIGTGEMIKGLKNDCIKIRTQKKLGIKPQVNNKFLFWFDATVPFFFIILGAFFLINELPQILGESSWKAKTFFFILIIINLLIQFFYMKKEKGNKTVPKRNTLIKCRWILKMLWLYGNIGYFLLVCVILLNKLDGIILGHITGVVFCIYYLAYFFYVLLNEIDAGEENIFNYLYGKKKGNAHEDNSIANTLAPFRKMTDQKAGAFRKKMKLSFLRKYISLSIVFFMLIICATIFIVFIPEYTNRTIIIYLYGSTAIISLAAYIYICIKGYRSRMKDINKELYYGKAVVIDINPFQIQYKDSEGVIKSVSGTINTGVNVRCGKEIKVVVTEDDILLDVFNDI